MKGAYEGSFDEQMKAMMDDLTNEINSVLSVTKDKLLIEHLEERKKEMQEWMNGELNE